MNKMIKITEEDNQEDEDQDVNILDAKYISTRFFLTLEVQ